MHSKRARGASDLRSPSPRRCTASLLARLDRLGPAAKQVAQTGAAIGREFSYECSAPSPTETSGICERTARARHF